MAMIKENYNPDEFKISVNGVVYTDKDEDGKKKGGVALLDTLNAGKVGTVVAEFCGFKISLNPIEMLENERTITLAGAGQYRLGIGVSASGNLTRIENFIKEFGEKEPRATARLEQLMRDFEVAKEQVKIPFEYHDELVRLNAELAELNEELNLNKRDEVVIDDGEESEEVPRNAVYSDKIEGGKKEKRRKKMTEELVKHHRQEKKKSEYINSIMVSFNDGYYEAIDDSADDLAEVLNLPVEVVSIGGEQVKTISLSDEQIVMAVNKLISDGRTVSIFDAPKEEKSIIDMRDFIAEMQVDTIRILRLERR